jgi:hypothetical protein
MVFIEHRSLEQLEVVNRKIRRLHTHELGRTSEAIADYIGVEEDLRTYVVHAGHYLHDAGDITDGEAWRKLFLVFLTNVVLNLLFLLFDNRLDDNIVDTDELYLIEKLFLSAISDGKHRDHSGNSENDTQCGEQRPNLVGNDS